MKITVSAALIVLLVSGCVDKKEKLPTAAESSKEDIVITNCYIVRDVVEAYAAQNGTYPILANQIWPLLPNDELLLNPFTGIRSEPKYGVAANPGAVGYVPVPDSLGAVGYQISGFGKTQIIIFLEGPNVPLVGRDPADLNE